MKIIINSIVIFIISWIWASIYWLGSSNLWQVDTLVSLQLNKPWVYRQLVPILARILQQTGFRVDIALCLIVALCGIGFYLSLRSWLICLYGESSFIEVSSLISCIVGLSIFGYERIPYDLCTAFLFTLSFYLICKKDYKFLVIFPFVVLNRETSFLLILFYVIYVGFSFMEISYLISVFGSIQGFLRLLFWDNSGASAWIEPWNNLLRFYTHPVQTALHLSISIFILFLVLYNWKSKDKRLVLSFLILLPITLVMYLVMGQAFEIRVFWEIYPLVIVLSIPTIKEFYYEMFSYQKDLLQHRTTS